MLTIGGSLTLTGKMAAMRQRAFRDKAVQANTQTFPWNGGNRQSSNTDAS